MLVLPSPTFTLEWGLCLLTLGFCWWRYRGTSAPKVVRMLLKKLEVFLLPTRTKPGEYVHQREEKYLHGIPTTKSELTAKRYGQKPEHLRKPFEDLNFYKPVSRLTPTPNESNDDSVLCAICCRNPQRKGLHKPERTAASTDLRNCLDCDTRAPHNPWYIRLCAYFVFFWRKTFIGEQYYMVKYKDMMADERVNKTIQEAARRELPQNPPPDLLEKLTNKHRKRTENIVNVMRAKQASNPWFSYFVRVASWIIGKTLGRIYPQILVRESQIEVIRKAREAGNPIVYLPIHRSHVDYVLVSWILVACDIRAPLVAAGDNLNIPIFSLLMRSVGGFFIKRKLDCQEGRKDIVYRTVLNSYITRTLTDDNDLEFFVEGGRTRTGKPCQPKGGLLSMVVETLLSNKVEDMLVVPVNFSYERLLDGNFIREQLGRPKVSESFASAALGLWNSLQAKFGSARIDFGKPFSLREYISAYREQRISPVSYHMSSNHGTKVNGEAVIGAGTIDSDTAEHRELVFNLAKHVIYEGQKCFTMMSTNAIAFLLLNKYRRGVSTAVLSKEIQALVDEMLKMGYDVSITGEMTEVVNHGLTVLGPALVRVDTLPGSNIFVRPVSILPNIIELAYYSNCVLPAYAMESVIATCISVIAGSEKFEGQEITVCEEELVQMCLEFCEILQYEFVFAPPCTRLESAVRSTISYMKEQKVLLDMAHVNGGMAEVNTGCHHARLSFLVNLVKPIMDTYHVAACVLKRIVDCEIFEAELHMDVLSEIKHLVLQNQLPFGESLALDPVKNFIKLMLEWEVLETFKFDRSVKYYLNDHFNSEKKVDKVIRRIQQFRQHANYS